MLHDHIIRRRALSGHFSASHRVSHAAQLSQGLSGPPPALQTIRVRLRSELPFSRPHLWEQKAKFRSRTCDTRRDTLRGCNEIRAWWALLRGTLGNVQASE